MTQLKIRRHEWFAYVRATGATLEEAYQRVGYVPSRAHACRLAARPDVAARINDLRSDMSDVNRGLLPDVIHDLINLAQVAQHNNTPQGFKEARAAYLSAAKLQEKQARELQRDRESIEQEIERLTPQERKTLEEAQPEHDPDVPFDINPFFLIASDEDPPLAAVG